MVIPIYTVLAPMTVVQMTVNGQTDFLEAVNEFSVAVNSQTEFFVAVNGLTELLVAVYGLTEFLLDFYWR